MSDDEDRPERYTPRQIEGARYEPPAKPGAGTDITLPNRNFVKAKVLGASAKAALDYERTQTERMKNAGYFLDAKAEGLRAEHRLRTVGIDNELYDEQRRAAIAAEREDQERSSKLADAQISEFEAVQAKYEADREEDLDRASAARLRREEREAKANGSDSGNIEARLAMRRERQKQCLVELAELDEEIASLNVAAGEGDPVAAGNVRTKRAQQVLLHEEVQNLKSEIAKLSAEL